MSEKWDNLGTGETLLKVTLEPRLYSPCQDCQTSPKTGLSQGCSRSAHCGYNPSGCLLLLLIYKYVLGTAGAGARPHAFKVETLLLKSTSCQAVHLDLEMSQIQPCCWKVRAQAGRQGINRSLHLSVMHAVTGGPREVPFLAFH